MRDFNGNRISGIVNINDSSQYGRPLETLSYGELVAEEAFRLKQWQQERSVRWKRFLLLLAVSGAFAAAAYITYLIWGSWQPVTILLTACSIATGCLDFLENGKPNRFETNHSMALRVIHDLYRIRGYRRPHL